MDGSHDECPGDEEVRAAYSNLREFYALPIQHSQNMTLHRIRFQKKTVLRTGRLRRLQ